MDRLLCFRDNQGRFLLVDRLTRKQTVISRWEYWAIYLLVRYKLSLPKRVVKLINRIISIDATLTADQIILFRGRTLRRPIKASWTMTYDCPYHCRFCAMRGLEESELKTDQKIKALEFLQKIGVIWLSLSGGEVLASQDFSEIYQKANDLGFMVKIQTTGYYLGLDLNHIQQVLLKSPPQEIVLSLYGALPETYDKVVGLRGAFEQFYRGLIWLKINHFKVKINIIVTKDSEYEVGEMINLARRFEFPWFVYTRLTPTFVGSCQPLKCMVNNPQSLAARFNPPESSKKTDNSLDLCQAGQSFFHLTAGGKVLPCQTVNHDYGIIFSAVDLPQRMKKLREETIIKRPQVCRKCNQKKCLICRPILHLYNNSGGLYPPNCVQKMEVL